MINPSQTSATLLLKLPPEEMNVVLNALDNWLADYDPESGHHWLRRVRAKVLAVILAPRVSNSLHQNGNESARLDLL